MKRVAWISGIVAVSAALGMVVDWRAPGIERESRDWLMRARGTLPAPEDIAIIAIDDASIEQLGRFPWPRTLMARAIDVVSAAQPKVIALDVLYVDPTAEDDALAQSIGRSGNVVAAAQLADAHTWLMPIPGIAKAATAVGHVNVATESDGVARELFLRLSDDSGHAIRAMAVEAVRVGDSIPEKAVVDGPRELMLGPRAIPFHIPSPAVEIGGPQTTLRPERIAIDYIGPTGSFGSQTYSFADVMEGRVPAANFRNKYVLIGATAASLGDRIASPFVHAQDAQGNQHGALMPGVEVLANAMNTILRSRFYRETPDLAAFLIAALVAGLTLLLLGSAQGGYEGWKQVGALAAMAIGIVLASYLVFTRALIFPPMTPALVSFASAGVLGLLRRSLDASVRLDSTIVEIGNASDLLIPESAAAGAAESIARIAGASGAEIVVLLANGKYRRVALYGDRAAERLEMDVRGGKLFIDHAAGRAPGDEARRVCAAIAASACETAKHIEGSRLPWPHGLEWKAQALARLGGRIHSRARFVDLALKSVEDGLIIAAPDGRITFANPRAACIFGSTGRALVGRDLFERLAEAEGGPPAYGGALAKLLVDQTTIEREIAVMGPRTMRYMLRMAAVRAGNGDDAALGIVASLSDITRQHELQQTKNDVVALVSHEMRTPLTAIQGMSELLAQYDLDAEQRRSMSLVINEEVKRLSRMIGNYLDLARLESGATVLHRSAVRVDALTERTLLLLDPVAAKRGIRLLRRFDADLPALLADPDLISRAISNLVANAIKYSRTGTEVTVRASSDNERVTISVADQGYGIAPEDLPRVFEKFFRVPRIEDAEDPVTERTGLGLALVREIAELHEGTVTAVSVVGSGSTFTLRLPRTKA